MHMIKQGVKWAVVLSLIISMTGFTAGRDYKYHSVFVYNFTKYIEWPGSNQEVVIGILGNLESANAAFKKMADLKSSDNKKFIIRNITDVNAVAGCQILFIPEQESSKLADYLPKLQGKPILVITEREGLIKKGSCINFVTIDGKLNIELNRSAIDQAGLKVSGQLLALAILV